MQDSVFVELRNEHNVKTFEALDGGPELICACKNHFVLLREVPWAEMQVMILTYADEHDAAMLEFFLQPSSSVRKSGAKAAGRPIRIVNQESPEALSIESIGVSSPNRFAQISGKYCSTKALQVAVEDHGLLAAFQQRVPTFTPVWHVVEEPYEVQRQVAKTMIAPCIRTMDWSVPRSNLDLVASARVIELMEGCSSSEAFLRLICEPLVQWFFDPVRKAARGVDTYRARRPLALSWFATWLAERGVLLFPMNIFGRGPDLFPVRYRYFLDSWIRPAEAREEGRMFYGRVADVVGEKEAGSRDRVSLLIRTMNLAAPGLAYGRVAAGWLKSAKEASNLGGEESLVVSSIWKLEAARLKSSGIDPHLLQSLTDLVIQRGHPAISAESELWAWVDDPNSKLQANARYVRKNFQAGPNLKAHVAELRGVFPAIAGKSPESVSGHLSIWLFFLSSLKDEHLPARIVDIKPGLLEALIRKNGETSLRAFMVSHQVSEVQQRNVFSTVRNAWRVGVREAGEDGILCPISDQMISIKGRGTEKRSSSSTRRSIDMEILDLLIEANRADDFAFSRGRAHSGSGQLLDYRRVTDPETGDFVSLWWPGVAVLMDVLLQIPVRHKQGRFLDSGEGDEFVLDIFSLQLRPNVLPMAENRRNQAFIQRVSLSPLRDEPGLGMYINTNKTGRDYAFPWLLQDIAVNVQLVVDWQKKYNPISAPISDRRDTREERVAKVEPILVYPIFRDPERHNHRPVSSGIVLDYFRALLKHVEAKYNLLNNTNIRFFRPNGDPVYDIHALRVTGVTRLLSMGVDPKIVRLLVGHSSLTMTWYYDHITNQRVASAMERALELRRPTREALFGMTHEEQEGFLTRLFNRSNQPTLALSLLRGLLDDQAPFLDMRVDGICPGQRCVDADVWRPRACSLCKFNVTGVPFLAGLELVLNDLMAELILNQQRVSGLRDQLYKKRREGVATRALEAEIAKLEEFVDNVLQQWEAQFQYVKKAEVDLVAWLRARPFEAEAESSTMELALVSPSIEKMGLALQETHHLALFTRLVEGAKRVEGFVPIVGAREARDGMLLEIVRHEKRTDLFYRLNPGVRKIALDQFALLLLEQDLSTEKISALIDGTVSLSAIPSAAEWLEQLSNASPTLLLTSGGGDHE